MKCPTEEKRAHQRTEEEGEAQKPPSYISSDPRISPPALATTTILPHLHTPKQTVIAPNRKKFYMWADNPWDEVNVNERVIVSAEDVAANGGEGGTWEVRVRSRDLATDKQTYSLVVTGAISPPGSAAEVQSVDATDDGASSAAMSVTVGVSPFLLTAAASLAVLLLAAF